MIWANDLELPSRRLQAEDQVTEKNRRAAQKSPPDRGYSPPKPFSPHSRKVERNGGAFWLYGFHAARAALANPRRTIRRAVLTDRAADELKSSLSRVRPEALAPDALARLLPSGAVHQGVALLCEPLPALDLEAALEAVQPGRRIVAVLDQITDPHNEGAILRSAAAFGVNAIVVQDRHAPPESGALAKAASGALDVVSRVMVVNIARALEELGRLGFWRIALAAEGDVALSEAAPAGDVALALGAEGAGLRRLVRERCDTTAFIPTMGAIDSLNVSNAAAIAFYELRRASRVPQVDSAF
jgi:23S rRNA (guanosine2251-2'-O)-methyltransferase